MSIPILVFPRDSLLLGSQSWLLLLVIVLGWAIKWAIDVRVHETKRTQMSCCTPNKYPHKEKLFGLDLLVKCTKALNRQNFLAETKEWMYNSKYTFEYLVFGNRAVITLDPINLQSMLSTQSRNFGLGKPRLDSLKAVLGNGVFNSEGDVWHSSRALLRQHVSRPHEEEITIFERNVQHLMKHIPTDGTSVDLQQLFAWLTLDTASEIFLGVSSNALLESAEECNDGRKFLDAFHDLLIASAGGGDINVAALFKSLFSQGRFKSNLKYVNDYMHRLIKKASKRQNAMKRETYLDALLEKSTPLDTITKDILNVLAAANDSTKTLLSNIWFILARRHDVYQAVRAEIDTLDGRIPSVLQVEQMVYLRYVIKETLRLYPPVALNQRTANCDTTLPRGAGQDGNEPMFIGKGTSIGYSLWALHRRTDIYGADAEEFRPERWRHLQEIGFAFLPFHAGPRRCVGQRLAMTQVAYITTRLIQQFTGVESRDTRPWTETIGLNCSSRHGVLVAFS